ncbi:MAG: YihY/virulence factor BrkB family protein [Acidobacteriota bacterium]
MRQGKRPIRSARHSLPFLWALTRAAFVRAYRDGAFGYAKGAAYSALLAFFPLLATTAAVLVRARADFISDSLSNFLSDVLPPGTQDLVFHYFATKGNRPSFVPITGALVSLWAGSGVIVSLMEGFHAIYRVPCGRPFVKERIIAILLVFSAAIPALSASIMILAGSHVERWAIHMLGFAPAGDELRGWVSVIGEMVRYLIAFGAVVLGACILYRVAPNRPQKWSRVWPGAVIATLLWLIATSGFAWYARHIANYNVFYGSIATVIVLLVWMYLLAIIAFIGCEFNAELEKAEGGTA